MLPTSYGTHPDPSMDLTYLYTVIFSAGVISYLLYRFLRPSPIPSIPYSPCSALSILGDIPSIHSHLAANPVNTFTTYATSLLRTLHSPLIQVFPHPFRPATLVLGDYAAAYELSVHRTREFDRSPTVGSMLSGFIPEHHILLRTDERWKAQRRLILGALSASVEGEKSPCGGRAWSAKEDVYLLALHGIMAFTFGAGVLEGRADAARVFEATLEITKTMGQLKGSLLPSVKWEIFRRRKRLRDARMVMEENVQRELPKAVAKMHGDRNATAMSAVEHMVAHERDLAEKEGRKPDYFSRVMVDEIAGFTIAAYETTGTTLCWGLKYLTDFPEIQSTLRHALEEGYVPAMRTGRPPTTQEILDTDVPYLEAVVQEILRFANPATAFDRQALMDTQILGHAVPKGTIVTCVLPHPALVSPSDIAESSPRPLDGDPGKPWDNPDLALFKPARWIHNGRFNPQAAPQVAFGLGPRACPGKQLAYLEIKAALVGALWNFELLPCPVEVSGYGKDVLATQKPKQCYLRLREITRPQEDSCSREISRS
ncbi:hypothetical protein BDW74DRAFT_183271 [Aspergillus multicolor]|uniref:uncharacterized protein n=1 Tax=Aspergillus multicolor TaxID=41759 RepID=UPI003CCDC55C